MMRLVIPEVRQQRHADKFSIGEQPLDRRTVQGCFEANCLNVLVVSGLIHSDDEHVIRMHFSLLANLQLAL